MIITFISITTLLLILFVLDNSIKRRGFYFEYSMIMLALFVVLFFFREKNTDYLAYLSFYEYIINNDNLTIIDVSQSFSFEPGFVAISMLANWFGLEARVFFLVLSLISFSVYLFVFSINKNITCQAIMLYLATYFIFNDLVQLRQGIAASAFMLITYLYAKNTRFSLFYPFLVIFHVSSIVSILAIPIKFIMSRDKYILTLVICFIIGCSAGVDWVFDLAINHNLLPEKVKSYHLSVYGLSVDVDSVRNIKMLSICLFIFVFWNRLMNEFFLGFICRLYVAGVSICFVFESFYIISVRLSQLFLVFEVLIIPNIMAFIIRSEKLKSTLILALSLVFLWRNTGM